MAKKSLKDLKSAFKSNTTENENGGVRKNNYYPFFRMDFDEKAVVRFLPDLNEDNPLGFLVEKVTHTLEINGERKTVPCLKSYEGEEECPICKRSAQFYKDEGDNTVNGKRLYRRKQHLAQVLVVEDPLPYKEGEETAQGTVKLLNISFSIYNKIKEAFEEDELENIPWDYEEGTDFMIKKTQKGKWANYDSSKFQKRERELTDDELAAIEGNLIDLTTLLPKKPTYEHLERLLEADLNGEVLDEGDAGPASKPAASKRRDDDEDEDAVVGKSQMASSSRLPDGDDDDDDDDGVSDDADDILADIRNRRRAQ